MSTLQTIPDTLVQDSIIRAVKNVCAKMLKRDADFVEKGIEGTQNAFKEKPHVFGSVGFVGKIDGIVYLCIPDDFALDAAARLLGMSMAEVEMSGDGTLKDVIGEITNMTVGGFKNGLCDAGYPCKLTIPSILRGSNFSIEPISSATRHTFNFDSGGHKLVADILLKAGD
jgi:chemotaxis protein CheX